MPFLSEDRRLMPVLLSACGALLLGYVSQQYVSMYVAQRGLLRQWEQQQRAVPDGRNDGVPGALSRITAAKIGLDAIVVEGTGSYSLSRGPGHMERTALAGQFGNAVIGGHRDTFFRRVAQLQAGDLLTVQRGGLSYQYQVTGTKIVDPNDVSVIQPTKDAELTLITCYPTYYIGPAPKRLVVFSKLVGDPMVNAVAHTGDEPVKPKNLLKKAVSAR